MDDYISRQAVIDVLKGLEFRQYIEFGEDTREVCLIRAEKAQDALKRLPSAQLYTDEEIQKMQEIEQTQIQKAFALGREDAESKDGTVNEGGITMAKIAHARRDENGTYFGGRAGDQDGKEVCVTEWYNRPWNKVLRCVDSVAREMIARAAEAAAANDHIGYDQHQRTTLYRAAELTNFDISKIDIDCECDCSSLVAVCVNAAGIKVSRNMYTGNEAAILIESGQFVEVGGEILRDPELAQRGDIWLYEGHHTAIQTTYGSKVALYPIGWHRDKGGWWYADTVNTFLFDRWADIGGNRYYFDHKGYAAEGLQVINNIVYYFMEHGKRTLDSKDDAKMMITDSSGAMQPFEV